MKAKILLLVTVLMLVLIISDSINNNALTNGVGAPPNMTGSPKDGLNCTHCHGGSASTQAGWITSDIPSQGYSPGHTYIITVKAQLTGKTKFGFEISPQNTSGALKGTLVNISDDTQLIGSGKYMTHSLSGTAGSSGSKTWTFSWVAPQSGSGKITFYGAFNASNADNALSGDKIFLSTMAVDENTTGIENITDLEKIQIYPNPSKGILNIENNADQIIGVKVYNTQGQIISVSSSKISNSQTQINLSGFEPGMYYIGLETRNGLISKPILLTR